MLCWFDLHVCVLVACGWGCGLLCFADLFVGVFDSCLVVFVVMVVYVWLGAFLWFVWGVSVVVLVFKVVVWMFASFVFCVLWIRLMFWWV